MANLQKKKNDALAIIDSALTIINKFPDINEANSQLSFNTSSNPFPFLMDVFKTTAGYNMLIQIISKFLIFGLPPLEIAVKGILLANIKNLLSCSINPFIPNEILRDGIVFNLEQIDISDTLKYSPTSTNGQYYYFDNKNKVTYDDGKTSGPGFFGTGGAFKMPDELKYSKDFNCLLWFMKNRASYREVWHKKVTDNDSFTKDSDYWRMPKKKKVDKTEENKGEDNKKGKCRKGAGILTLEFNERAESLKNAEGNGMSIQTPYNNCLHVFLGNTQHKIDTTFKGLDSKIIEYSKTIQKCYKEIDKLIKQVEKLKKTQKELDKQLKKDKISPEIYKARTYGGEEVLDDAIKRMEELKAGRTSYELYALNVNSKVRTEETDAEGNVIKEPKYREDLRDIMMKALDYQKQCNLAASEKVNCIKQQQALNLEYRTIEENYYYRHTLIEFNTDYVMSLRLFDAKVVAAQLIDSLTGLLTIDLDLSFKQQLIKNEVKKMVEMIIETDDTVVDDCFFTFTNDSYNAMLEKAELNRMGLFSVNGELNTTAPIDAEELLSSLNELDEDAVQSGNVTVIEHALTTISNEIATNETDGKEKINFGVQMNFIENLLNNLAYVITNSVLSPKVYLLILVNLEILGKDTNFNLQEFIGKYKQMLADVLRQIRDQLLTFLTNELRKILEKIAVEAAIKMTIEQMEYYNELIRKIIECFKNKNNGLDFVIDKIDHADIISEEVTEKKKEC